MQILAIGDLHGDFLPLQHLVQAQRPDVVLSVGDFGYWPRQKGWPAQLDLGQTSVYFCDGNHEDHDALAVLAASGKTEILPNVHYMSRGSILTLNDGRTVLFAGGARSHDKWHREEGVDWFPLEVPRESDYLTLPIGQHIDIVVSHTAPTCFKIPNTPIGDHDKWTWHFKLRQDPTRATLNKLVFRNSPTKWFFGHFHAYMNGLQEGVEWTCLPPPVEGAKWWIRI